MTQKKNASKRTARSTPSQKTNNNNRNKVSATNKMSKRNKPATTNKPSTQRRTARNNTNNTRRQKVKQTRVEAPYPHFRYYLKSGHPALIIGEQPIEEYRYRKVMHSDKDGGRNNEIVIPNPNPNDPDPMYIGKRVRHDKKENFESKPLTWIYPGK